MNECYSIRWQISSTFTFQPFHFIRLILTGSSFRWFLVQTDTANTVWIEWARKIHRSKECLQTYAFLHNYQQFCCSSHFPSLTLQYAHILAIHTPHFNTSFSSSCHSVLSSHRLYSLSIKFLNFNQKWCVFASSSSRVWNLISLVDREKGRKMNILEEWVLFAQECLSCLLAHRLIVYMNE